MELQGESEFPRTSAILRKVGQVLCAVGGHNLLMRFDPDRVALECSKCGYRSQGWHVGRHSRVLEEAPDRAAHVEGLQTHRQLA